VKQPINAAEFFQGAAARTRGRASLEETCRLSSARDLYAMGGIMTTSRSTFTRQGLLIVLAALLSQVLAPGPLGGGQPPPAYRRGIEESDGTELINIQRVEHADSGAVLIRGNVFHTRSPSRSESQAVAKVLREAIADLKEQIRKSAPNGEHLSSLRDMLKMAEHQLKCQDRYTGQRFRVLWVTVLSGAKQPLFRQYVQLFPAYSDQVEINRSDEPHVREYTIRVPSGLEPGKYTVFVKPMDVTSIVSTAMDAGSDAVTFEVGG
jgi:hypothetical protein